LKALLSVFYLVIPDAGELFHFPGNNRAEQAQKTEIDLLRHLHQIFFPLGPLKCRINAQPSLSLQRGLCSWLKGRPLPGFAHNS
jgi:hypothetical protein